MRLGHPKTTLEIIKTVCLWQIAFTRNSLST